MAEEKKSVIIEVKSNLLEKATARPGDIIVSEDMLDSLDGFISGNSAKSNAVEEAKKVKEEMMSKAEMLNQVKSIISETSGEKAQKGKAQSKNVNIVISQTSSGISDDISEIADDYLVRAKDDFERTETSKILIKETIPRWIKNDMTRLDKAVMDLFAKRTGAQLRIVFGIANNMRRQGELFGHNPISFVASMMCHVIELLEKRAAGCDDAEIAMLKKHVEVMKIVVGNQIKGNDGKVPVISEKMLKTAKDIPANTTEDFQYSKNIANLSFLVVDDNKHMRALVKSILHSFGSKNVHDASNGSEAYKELKVFPADIIITDWNMAPMNGVEFTRLVRTGKDSPNPFTPIIMLTGHTERHRIMNARDSGVNELLAKPISAKGLYSRICAIIENPREFVRTKNYFGPDRRRKNSEDYKGMERRKTPPVMIPIPTVTKNDNSDNDEDMTSTDAV